jgi:hypothetical protein
VKRRGDAVGGVGLFFVQADGDHSVTTCRTTRPLGARTHIAKPFETFAQQDPSGARRHSNISTNATSI